MAAEAIVDVLRAMRMNGQVCGREWPMVRTNQVYSVRVMIPAADALDDQHHNRYVRLALQDLAAANLDRFAVTVVGADLEGSVCECLVSTAYILYNYDRLISPVLRCGDCFSPLPYYCIPPLRNDEYFDIISWETSYKSCDDLRAVSSLALDTAVRYELFNPASDLCQFGRAICTAITASTGRPAYYTLYRYGGEVEVADQRWRCPACHQPWFVAMPWHDFDFVCHPCGLVSTRSSDAG
jgi:predicted  nucleic acid-binding Zn ribbon protein